MVTLCIDLRVGQSCARCDNASEGAFDEFARLRGLDLVDDGDFDALIEQLLDVAL